MKKESINQDLIAGSSSKFYELPVDNVPFQSALTTAEAMKLFTDKALAPFRTYTTESFLCGELDSDGSIHFSLSRVGQLSVVIQFTSKTNTNTIAHVQKHLTALGIQKMHLAPKSDGSASLRVKAEADCLKLVELIKNTPSVITADFTYPLSTPSLRSLYVVHEYLCYLQNHGSVSNAVKIDLHKTIGKASNSDPDRTVSIEERRVNSPIDRADLEASLGVKQGDSIGAADFLTKKADEVFLQALQRFEQIGNGSIPGTLATGYVSGFFCGEAHFDVQISAQQRDNATNINFRPVIEVTQTLKYPQVLKLLKRYFGFAEKVPKKDGRVLALIWRRNDLTEALAQYFTLYPVIGDVKTESFNLIREVYQRKAENNLFKRDLKGDVDKIDSLKNFIQRLYDASEKRKQGPGRSQPITYYEKVLNDHYYI